MSQIAEYQLLRVSDRAINRAVNEMIALGWQPFGSPLVYDDENGETVLAQAVIRYSRRSESS